jgi:hypothetical protein
MNEQIKQFAVKAGFPEWSHKTVGFELEQFAELIVFECIKIAVFKGDSATGKAIKQHFEVEL